MDCQSKVVRTYTGLLRCETVDILITHRETNDEICERLAVLVKGLAQCSKLVVYQDVVWLACGAGRHPHAEDQVGASVDGCLECLCGVIFCAGSDACIQTRAVKGYRSVGKVFGQLKAVVEVGISFGVGLLAPEGAVVEACVDSGGGKFYEGHQQEEDCGFHVDVSFARSRLHSATS